MCLLQVSIKISAALDLGIWSSVCRMPLACVCLVSMVELQQRSSVKWLVALELQGVKVYRHVLSLLLLQPCQVIVMSEADAFKVLYMLEEVCLISINLNIRRVGRGLS